MFEIWHAINPSFGLEFLLGHKEEKPNFPGDFHLVAKVRCDEPEEAFSLTQHLDEEWWKNDKVYLVKESRSTSVGDFIIAGHVAYQVLSMGYRMFTYKDGQLFELEEQVQ
jgi:hypothetical protein